MQWCTECPVTCCSLPPSYCSHTTVVTEEPHHGDERPVAEVPQKAFSAADGTEGSFWSGLDWGVESIAEAVSVFSYKQ